MKDTYSPTSASNLNPADDDRKTSSDESMPKDNCNSVATTNDEVKVPRTITLVGGISFVVGTVIGENETREKRILVSQYNDLLTALRGGVQC